MIPLPLQFRVIVVRLHDKLFEPFITEQEVLREISGLAQQISEDYQGKDPIFVSVLNGAFMFTSDLLKEVKIPCEVTFVKVSSYHGVSTTGRVDELIGLNTSIHDRHVILVEDIVDTGITMDKLMTLVRLKQPASVKICSLLFKPDAFKGKHSPDYIGFSIPDNFVVGYGLDYNELGRNLREIYKLKEEIPH